MKVNYGLIAVPKDQYDRKDEKITILHFCGYEEMPEDIDINELYAELRVDPEFKIDQEFVIISAWPEVMELFSEQIKAIESSD